MKKIIIIGSTLILLAIIVFWQTRSKEVESYQLVRGEVINYTYEMGIVSRGDNIQLSFPVGGTIQERLVNSGEKVIKGTPLVSLDKRDIQARLTIAEKALLAAKASLTMVQSEENYSIAELSLQQAEESLSSAEKSLEDTISLGETRIESSEREGKAIISSASLVVSDVMELISDVNTKFLSGTVTTEVRDARQKLDIIRVEEKKIEESWQQARNSLDKIYSSLEFVFNIIEEMPNFTTADRQAFNTVKTSVNQSYSAVSSLIQGHEILLSTIETETNIANAQYNTAKTAYQRAEKEWQSFVLNRPEEITIYSAKVTQAEKERDLLARQLADATLKAPFDGEVGEIMIQTGEIVAPNQTVIVFRPDNPFHIEANIYEGDIANIDIDTPVEIELVAFPDDSWSGEVFSIDSNPKLIDGVVHYQILITINEAPDNLRSGMTSDLKILSEREEDVLFMPVSAVRNKKVKVWRDNRWQEHEVVTGVRGEGIIEIKQGLEEGDYVAI